jgi:hypothetical protein
VDNLRALRMETRARTRALGIRSRWSWWSRGTKNRRAARDDRGRARPSHLPELKAVGSAFHRPSPAGVDAPSRLVRAATAASSERVRTVDLWRSWWAAWPVDELEATVLALRAQRRRSRRGNKSHEEVAASVALEECLVPLEREWAARMGNEAALPSTLGCNGTSMIPPLLWQREQRLVLICGISVRPGSSSSAACSAPARGGKRSTSMRS